METRTIIVRVRAGRPEDRHYSAGLGPFGREPRVVRATAYQQSLLEADPVLVLAPVGDDTQSERG